MTISLSTKVQKGWLEIARSAVRDEQQRQLM
jgi:hypothetical protein